MESNHSHKGIRIIQLVQTMNCIIEDRGGHPEAFIVGLSGRFLRDYKKMFTSLCDKYLVIFESGDCEYRLLPRQNVWRRQNLNPVVGRQTLRILNRCS